jgi:hypothetical protein
MLIPCALAGRYQQGLKNIIVSLPMATKKLWLATNFRLAFREFAFLILAILVTLGLEEMLNSVQRS